MTDAQPAEQVVTALRKAEGWLLADPEPTPILRADLAAIRAALPIAREMAERIRIADHIVTRLGRRPTAAGDYRGYAWAQAEAELAVFIEQYLALDRARAAGVEVTGHE